MVAWRHSRERLTDKENKRQQQASMSRATGPTAAFSVKEIAFEAEGSEMGDEGGSTTIHCSFCYCT
jgi:hypothetical protein